MGLQGVIDLHLHGIGTFDTRSERVADIQEMARILGREGVSWMLPTVYPAPIGKMRACMDAVRKAMAAPRDKGAGILGVNLEGPFLAPEKCGALDSRAFLVPAVSNLKQLINGFEDIVKIVTVAPELRGAHRVIEWCSSRGIRVNMGHSKATYKQALEGMRAGATGITHLFNAMEPFHHREPGLAGFGLLDSEIYVELIADGIHLSPEVLKLVFKVKPKERILIVSDAVQGPTRRKGVIQGGKKSVIQAKSLLRGLGISEARIAYATEYNPRRYLGI